MEIDQEMKTALKAGLPGFQPVLPDHTADTLCAFGQAVIEQNKVMNLTAITDPVQVAKLHLLDSLTLTRCLDLKGKRLIDVGCGAGFPGVPIAIACPDTDVTLLDSLGWRRSCRSWAFPPTASPPEPRRPWPPAGKASM